MRRLSIVSFALLMSLPLQADALTVRDVVELSRAGLGDEILLALIEVDRSVFPVDAATLKGLKESGVGERVILAMIRSQRMTPAVPVVEVSEEQEAPAAAPPQVVVIDHHDEDHHDEPRVREVLVPVPVYVPVVRRHRSDDDYVRSVRDRNDPRVDSRHQPIKSAEPVYWGWGGKLRPDAWKPR